jgi:hypothetical protein
MSEKRIVAWVQAFKDRVHLFLQWIDPATGRPLPPNLRCVSRDH